MFLRANILKGKLELTGSREWVKSRIALFADGEYSIEIKPYKKPRSLNQNRYLHAVLIPCFREALREAGYDEVKTDEDAKLVMKGLFLKRSMTNHETGEVIEYVLDTHSLTIEEMAQLYEDVWKFSSENLNYNIPSPGTQASMNLGY